MSCLNIRNCNLELKLSMPDIISCVKKDFWFPITSIEFPTFEVTRKNILGLFFVPRVIKNGSYKIHCSMSY